MNKRIVLLLAMAASFGAILQAGSLASAAEERNLALSFFERAIALDPELIMYDEPFAGLDPISMGVICALIRTLNDALGATSIIVSHDVKETFSIADYVYFVANGTVAAEGTPEDLSKSTLPFVHQFVHGEKDGPVPFHYAANDYKRELLEFDNQRRGT